MSDDFPGVRYSTATLDWAREEHETLGTLGKDGIHSERLRARLVRRALVRLLTLLR